MERGPLPVAVPIPGPALGCFCACAWDVTSFGVVGQMTPRATRPRVTPPLTTSLHRTHLCTPNTNNTAAGRASTRVHDTLLRAFDRSLSPLPIWTGGIVRAVVATAPHSVASLHARAHLRLLLVLPSNRRRPRCGSDQASVIDVGPRAGALLDSARSYHHYDDGRGRIISGEKNRPHGGGGPRGQVRARPRQRVALGRARATRDRRARAAPAAGEALPRGACGGAAALPRQRRGRGGRAAAARDRARLYYARGRDGRESGQ